MTMPAVLHSTRNMFVKTSSINASVGAFCTRLQILFACAEDCRYGQSDVSRYACRHVRGQLRWEGFGCSAPCCYTV